MEEQSSDNENCLYCSNCGQMINKNANICPKCGAELVEVGENVNDENIIVIKTFNNEFEAEMAKSLLEEEEIECFISKDDEGSMYPSLQLTLGVNLHVFEKDAEKALEIIKSMETQD